MASDVERILRYKPAVDAHLRKIFTGFRKDAKGLAWSSDALDHISTFAVSGKTVRGSITAYAYFLFTDSHRKRVLDLAVAMELFQSGLLIHDDIMDQDALRRGKPTIHIQYRQAARKGNGRETARYGTNQAINIGDVCFFLAFRLLSGAGDRIVRLVSTELGNVAFAQMQDVAGSHLPASFNPDEVMSLYLHKTARYTFSLPFMAGALLAGAPDAEVSRLEYLGEALGMLYQIRDDELNLNDPSVTGKSRGSDRTNRKQTLHALMDPHALSDLRNALREQADTHIKALSIPDSRKREFLALLEFCESRQR